MNGPVTVMRVSCYHCGGDRDVQVSAPVEQASEFTIEDYPDERECWCLGCGRVEMWAWRAGAIEEYQRSATYLAA